MKEISTSKISVWDYNCNVKEFHLDCFLIDVSTSTSLQSVPSEIRICLSGTRYRNLAVAIAVLRSREKGYYVARVMTYYLIISNWIQNSLIKTVVTVIFVHLTICTPQVATT